MILELKTFDAADYLDDEDSLAAYLEDAIEDGDPEEFSEALCTATRAIRKKVQKPIRSD